MPIVQCPPHELPRLAPLWGDRAEAVSGSSLGRHRQSPQAPSIANRCRRIWFLSVVHDHRPVARWRPPRSTYLLRGQRTELEAHRRRLSWEGLAGHPARSDRVAREALCLRSLLPDPAERLDALSPTARLVYCALGKSLYTETGMAKESEQEIGSTAKPQSACLRISASVSGVALRIRCLTFPWHCSSGFSSGA